MEAIRQEAVPLDRDLVMIMDLRQMSRRFIGSSHLLLEVLLVRSWSGSAVV